MTPPDAPRVHEFRDLPYAERAQRTLLLDLFVPADVARPAPVVLWLHGGGFRIGNRSFAPDLAAFAARTGFATAAIDYRLSHEAIYPAALDDVAHALAWLRGAAPDYGYDPRRIALWGGSAGGYLAAMTAIASRGGAPREALAGVVVAYAPIDFLQIDAHRRFDQDGLRNVETGAIQRGERSADPDSRESLFMGAPIETIPDRIRAANPITHVDGREPPFLILHGGADPIMPEHQSLILFEALAARGVDVTLRTVDGLGHAFLNRPDVDLDIPRGTTIRMPEQETGGTAVSREETPVLDTIASFLGRCFDAV